MEFPGGGVFYMTKKFKRNVSSFIIIGMSRGIGGLRKEMDVDIF